MNARSAGEVTRLSSRSLHQLGVICGLGAGAWLGAAEAPTKLVTVGFSPFLISLGMVAGVFVARWTLPMMLKGTHYIWLDFREKPHLIVWAILAGMLWAVANTLTVFAIRNVGLSIAFPLWNSNSLVGIFGAGCSSTNCAAPVPNSGSKFWVEPWRSWSAPACWHTPLPIRLSAARLVLPWEFWPQFAPARFGAPCISPIARRTSAA